MTESEARDIFIQSKLAVSEFAQIWTLCLGHKQAGSIDFGSFCVFMHLVNARRRGIALPSTMPVQLKELLPVDVREYSKVVAQNVKNRSMERVL